MTIGYWCILAAILLPYLCFGVARNRGRNPQGVRLRDNNHPRDFPNHLHGVAQRAWNAHLNAFEALPGFAAAVIIAHLAHAPQHRIDTLALTWWPLVPVTPPSIFSADTACGQRRNSSGWLVYLASSSSRHDR